jgi:single-strand DNA-binding protein
MNVVILSGNLARDPDLRFTGGGTAIAEATVCVTTRYRAQSGEQKERTAFVGIVIWGQRGEAFAKHHKKGSRACVRGEIITESWEDKTTGKRQSKTKVQVDDWEFSGSKQDDAPAAPAPAPARPTPRPSEPYRPQSSDWPDMTAQNNPTTPPPQQQPPEDDDVPF